MDHSAGFPHAIHLEVGEPDEETPDNIKAAAIQAIENGWTHYTPNAGLVSLRQSIQQHVKDKYQIQTSLDQIIVTPGAVTALAASLLTVVDYGEEVLLPDPGWPNYEQMILSQNAVPVFYPLDIENNFNPKMEALEKLVTAKTKAIVINTPSNPTGAVFDEDAVKDILYFAGKHDLYVISDEVYDGIVFEGKHSSPFSFDQENRVISVFGFSKNYAMTGWRVGYALVPSHVAPVMTKVLEPLVSCASSISQKGAEEAISGPQDFITKMKEKYKVRRDKAFKIFLDHDIKAYLPSGSFYMLIDISETELNSKDFAISLLEKEQVAVAPGATFGKLSKQMIRISLATAESELLNGCEKIAKYIKKYSSKEKVTESTLFNK